MKISQITIRNFRRLEDVTLDLHDQQTLLVGPNNSGKTSVSAALRYFIRKGQAFSLYDLSLSQVIKLDSYTPDNEEIKLPKISIDLWFQFEADKIEFGQIFGLLDTLSTEINEVGIRCTYCVHDEEDLWRAYTDAYPEPNEGDEEQRKPLSYFLSLDNNFNKFFVRCFYSLHKVDEALEERKLDRKTGEKTLASLIRVDFVDAQRDMSDSELGRSRKLSSAFTYFYNKNLTQPEIDSAAKDLITKNNDSLTEHYGASFSEIMGAISELGVPAVHDRKMKIVSNIEAETALKENSMLMYVDEDNQHELPEAYNGLGFKNLIFMVIQIIGFHREWVETEESRPLTHLIFIEEPEAHLHAQVQQTFIENVWSLLRSDNEDDPKSQFAITTHSSHVVNSANFDQVRYFCRCRAECDEETTGKTFNATAIKNLEKFTPKLLKVTDEPDIAAKEVRDFIKKYVALPHCDLFFADGVIFIEGSVERILMPEMIRKVAPGLSSKYISILEVGGAYAHRFSELMKFLELPYIVITDLDSVIVEPDKTRASACIASEPNAYTSNAVIKFYTGKKNISELNALTLTDRTYNGECMISYQQPKAHTIDGVATTLEARTLEEAFIFENLDAIQSGNLLPKIKEDANSEDLNRVIFDLIRGSRFKKTDFALDVISSTDWVVPQYIKEALIWLQNRLEVAPAET